MALAILLILLYHNKGALPEGFLKQAAGFCYVGVDIFFFASGVGCFFSYLRDRDPVSFLRRRAGRILPAYLPFILVWIVLQAVGGGLRSRRSWPISSVCRAFSRSRPPSTGTSPACG